MQLAAILAKGVRHINRFLKCSNKQATSHVSAAKRHLLISVASMFWFRIQKGKKPEDVRTFRLMLAMKIRWSILPTDPCEGRGHGDVCSYEREELKICLRWRGGGGVGLMVGASVICGSVGGHGPESGGRKATARARRWTAAGGWRPETLTPCNLGLGRGERGDRREDVWIFCPSEWGHSEV
jgi:hypothetical protein